MPIPHEGRGELQRLELFSDAVFAIAITLLVLELKVPGDDAVRAAGGLGHALIAEIPRFAAYFISFVVIGNYWILHHEMFRRLRRSDEALVGLNLLLLLLVAFLPFPVALFGEHRRDPVAVGFYAVAVALTGLVLNLLWIHATRNRRLVAPDLDARVVRFVTFRAAAVPVTLAASLPFMFVSRNWAFFALAVSIPLIRFFGGRLKRASREAEEATAATTTPALAPAAILPPAPIAPPAGSPPPA